MRGHGGVTAGQAHLENDVTSDLTVILFLVQKVDGCQLHQHCQLPTWPLPPVGAAAQEGI